MNASPPEFDPGFYIGVNPDLATLSAEQAEQHFRAHGAGEGRPGNRFSFREFFLPLMSQERSTLEIGPFLNPLAIGPHVKYFEVLNSEQLIARAAVQNYPCEQVPNIDFMSPTGDLSIVDQQFDQVFSSHCIEHQPDLIRHLQQVEALLAPEGMFFLIIPDFRYCFDHFLPASSMADVIDAHMSERRLHSVSDFLKHRCMTTHNDPAAHWAGQHGDEAWRVGAGPQLFQYALNEFAASGGAYLDTHAWQFTPGSFREIVAGLHALGLSPLAPLAVFNTPRDRFEFCAILGRSPAV